MIELSNITFLKDKNIQNQQAVYNSDRLPNLTSNNDNGDIDKQKKNKKRGWEYLKIWVGIFLVGIFWVEIFRREFTRGEFDWWEVSGWEFLGGSFTDT